MAGDEHATIKNQKKLADAVRGKTGQYYAEESAELENIRQIEKICLCLKVPVPEKKQKCRTMNEQIELALRASGATKRLVELSDRWWKDGDGPLLAQIKGTQDVIALLPGKFRGYYYIDRESGEKITVTKKNKDQFEHLAYCFYKPLPNRPMTGRDYIRFVFKQLSPSDILILCGSILFITLFGMITPFATNYAFSNLIPSGDRTLLIPLGILLVVMAVGTWLLNIVKSSALSRISNRLDVLCENAVYARLLRLPATFFANKSSGELAQKAMALYSIAPNLVELIFGTFLTVFISLIYIVQILTIADCLAFPVLVIYIVELLLFAYTIIQEKKYLTAQMIGNANNSGLVYALISGIQKIKISGSEKRAYAKWLESYTEKTAPAYAIRFPFTMRVPLITAIHLLGTLWIYIIAYKNGVSAAQFAAFSSAFAMAMAGISALGASGTSIAMIRPTLKLGAPILEEVPEESIGKKTVSSLTGRIDLENVLFQYEPDSPPVINNINLHIDPGEYVAIVGKSGCGKSTLLKLLLGFQTPQQGAVYYDSMDLRSLDLQSLRQHIGTVLQDGKLFTGDLYHNITISAPWLSVDEAWDAAERAGMAADIQKMPMGMHTLISEGSGGVSGGQKQRILIARALAPKPKIVMFDEATSALDNITQKIVTDSLDAMSCTRIVIAHRLSTIRNCSRIIVLDRGVVAEDGSYDELYAKGGLFTELVKRQMTEEA